jgi:hypothetical protein
MTGEPPRHNNCGGVVSVGLCCCNNKWPGLVSLTAGGLSGRPSKISTTGTIHYDHLKRDDECCCCSKSFGATFSGSPSCFAAGRRFVRFSSKRDSVRFRESKRESLLHMSNIVFPTHWCNFCFCYHALSRSCEYISSKGHIKRRRTLPVTKHGYACIYRKQGQQLVFKPQGIKRYFYCFLVVVDSSIWW